MTLTLGQLRKMLSEAPLKDAPDSRLVEAVIWNERCAPAHTMLVGARIVTNIFGEPSLSIEADNREYD